MKLHAIVVTFRRPTELAGVVAALQQQTRPPDTITVVDNDPCESAAALVTGSAGISYVATGSNLGPAGGLAVGFAAVDRDADDRDCVVFVDDNDPPPKMSTLEELVAFRSNCPVERPRLAAVGLAGARYNRRSGMLRRLADLELVGAVRVQYLGGGQFPVYSVSALRAVGGPRTDLFFGFEELELGLRLEDHGYCLFGAGPIWATRRAELGRKGLSPREAAASRAQTPWRRYYSTRNLIWIARNYGGLVAAFWVTVRSGLGGAARDVVIQRSVRAAWPALRGVCHGWLGRLGVTVEVSLDQKS